MPSTEVVERLSAIDVAVARVSDDAGELTQRVALGDSHREANDARIAANTEAVRRAHAEQRAMEARADAGERMVDELSERVNAALQSLRRVIETSDQWDDLAATIEAMRGRAEDSRRMLDEASAMAASVRRSFEAFEERMGDIERGAEQLRSRDGHRERALAALGDEVEQIRDEASREQQRFVALQERSAGARSTTSNRKSASSSHTPGCSRMTDAPNTASGRTAPSTGGSAGVLERFAEWLPITDSTPRISLGEGSTPLVRAASLERRTGAAEVWLKLEMCNPTASFKDRGMVLAVAKALEEGATAVLCASTGTPAPPQPPTPPAAA